MTQTIRRLTGQMALAALFLFIDGFFLSLWAASGIDVDVNEKYQQAIKILSARVIDRQLNVILRCQKDYSGGNFSVNVDCWNAKNVLIDSYKKPTAAQKWQEGTVIKKRFDLPDDTAKCLVFLIWHGRF